MPGFLKKALRYFITFIFATVSSYLAAAMISGLFTLWYRAHNNIPAGTDIIEDYSYVMYNMLIALPVLIIVFFFLARFVWRWSKRFESKTPPKA